MQYGGVLCCAVLSLAPTLLSCHLISPLLNCMYHCSPLPFPFLYLALPSSLSLPSYPILSCPFSSLTLIPPLPLVPLPSHSLTLPPLPPLPSSSLPLVPQVQITRNSESLECVSMTGLYPTGEGAGYAGGIVVSTLQPVDRYSPLIPFIQCYALLTQHYTLLLINS